MSMYNVCSGNSVKCEVALCLVQAQDRLRARVRVKTLAMWTDQGRLGQELCKVNPLLAQLWLCFRQPQGHRVWKDMHAYMTGTCFG